MGLEEQLKQLRREIEKLGRPGRGKRYPAELRNTVTEYIVARREDGSSWYRIAADLGLSSTAVKRWHDMAREAEDAAGAPAFKPVRVTGVEHIERGVVVVCPGGYRVEGLSVDSAAALLRALG
jgi:transposase